MSPLVLAYAAVRDRPLAAGLNAGLAALGVGVAVAMMLIATQLADRMVRDGAGIDLVVGPKGSPLQLILSSVHHADVPVGNIPLAEAQHVAAHPMVGQAIPLALGDSHAGFRIVGSTPAYMALYGGEFADGGVWQRPLQAVLGADVAAATGLGVGDGFISSHGMTGGDAGAGMQHAHAGLTVTGVLAPTGAVLDRLIVTSLDSVWIAHGEAIGQVTTPGANDLGWALSPGPDTREITALLVSYAAPIAAVRLPRQIDTDTALMAAKPAEQMQRLFALLGAGFDVMAGFAWVMVGAAGCGVLVSLLGQMRERQKDIALMRVMGASPWRVFVQVLIEGVCVAGLGAVLGLVVGHGLAQGFAGMVPHLRAAGVNGVVFMAEEIAIVLLACGVGIVGALLPAALAYRVDLAVMIRR